MFYLGIYVAWKTFLYVDSVQLSLPAWNLHSYFIGAVMIYNIPMIYTYHQGFICITIQLLPYILIKKNKNKKYITKTWYELRYFLYKIIELWRDKYSHMHMWIINYVKEKIIQIESIFNVFIEYNCKENIFKKQSQL